MQLKYSTSLNDQIQNENFKINNFFLKQLTSGGACIAKNESKPSSASKPPLLTAGAKSFVPQAEIT